MSVFQQPDQVEGVMPKPARNYCPHCGKAMGRAREDGVLRDFCTQCRRFFYDNPLPVVSALVVADRRLLLVRRGNRPYRGRWCLPIGFAEVGESIEEATLRELREEAGIEGRVTGLVDVDSVRSGYYGDLIVVTFEVEARGGVPTPGSDTTQARYFPLDALPRMAFSSNRRAVSAFIRQKADAWAIADSFSRTIRGEAGSEKVQLLSDALVDVIERNAERIVNLWIADVRTNRSTPAYNTMDPDRLFRRAHRIVSQFGRWMGGGYDDGDVMAFYMQLGRERRREGLPLSEVLSALSLIRKHIWTFALSRGVWDRTLAIYMALELDRRIVVFFDKAAVHTARGYEASDPSSSAP